MENKKITKNKSDSGFSLMELLAAVFLSSLLLLGLTKIYLSVQESYRLQNSLLNIQEKMRLLSRLLTYRVRMAGFAGCDHSVEKVKQPQAIVGYQKGDNAVLALGECYPFKNREQFMRVKYFVAKTSRKNSQGSPIYALYQQPIGSRRIELAEGISKMQIKYGIATQDAKNIKQYISAPQVSDWKKVRSVDIKLLFNSIDQRIKKSFNLYISLRE